MSCDQFKKLYQKYCRSKMKIFVQMPFVRVPYYVCLCEQKLLFNSDLYDNNM